MCVFPSNINGFTPDKFFSLYNYFLSFSLIFLVETWLKPDSSFHYNLPGYSHIVFCRQSLAKKASRGSGGLILCS